MEQLFVKHKLYNSPKEVQKHLMNVTAKLRQQVLEDAALEDVDAVKNGIYDLVKKCHLETIRFLKDKYKIEIKYDENNPQEFYEENQLLGKGGIIGAVVKFIIIALLIVLFFNKNLLSKINITASRG